MARQFGLKPLSVTRPSGPQPKAIPALRIVSEAKQSVQRPKPLYAPASWRGASDRRSTSGAH